MFMCDVTKTVHYCEIHFVHEHSVGDSGSRDRVENKTSDL